MAERPDLRKIAGDIRVALDTYPREALVDILTYVFQTYVVEGAPTLHAAQPERLTELEGLPFPELMQALQARLDVPELALFDVQGGRVTLRSGGEAIPVSLSPADRRASAAPLGPAAPAPTPEEPAGRPAQQAQPEAPRARGVSISSNPGSAANPTGRQAPSAPAPAPRPAPAAPPRQAAAPAQAGGQRQAASDADPGDDDAASRRFKLLEID